MNAGRPVSSTLRVATLLRVFLPFALGYFLSYLYRVVNAVIAPDLVAEIGLDAAQLGLLTSAYFLTFGIFQLPLGMLLDRFGSRRTEAALLLVAALGALVFATADSASGLTLGRALIGLGVSACLMGAFKAFVLWFPKERLPLVNGLQMASGGLGALTGTAPVQAALQITTWRGVFIVLAILTALVALTIFFVVPERREHKTGTRMAEQFAGIKEIFLSPVFWRIVPWTVTAQATFLSVQSLWMGPWLRDVAGLERATVASYLALVACAMIAGWIIVGFVTVRVGRLGVRPIYVAALGMSGFMLLLLPFMFEWISAALPVCMLFGFFGSTGILPYAVLSQSFAPELAGRVNTGLNLMVFLGAFAAQWGIGAMIDFWPRTASGGYAPAGYQAALGVMFALQAAGMVWFVLAGRRVRKPVT
jgi:sugar phosphate permease